MIAPRGPHRMAQRDGAAVGIHLFRVDAEALVDRERLRREGLVRFESRFRNRRSPGRSAPEGSATAGTGPIAHHLGAHPRHGRSRSTRARGFRPAFSAASARASTMAAAPSLMPLAFPAVTEPSFRNTVLRPASASGVVALGCSSVSKATISASDLHFDRHDLLLEAPFLDGAGGAFLAFQPRKPSLIGAGDLVLVRDVFRRHAHVPGAEGAVQRADHHVERAQHRPSSAPSAPRAGCGVRGSCLSAPPARPYSASPSASDCNDRDDGLRTGPAKPVHVHRGRRVGHAGLHRGHAAEIQCPAVRY